MIDLLPSPQKKAVREEYHLRVFVVSLVVLSLLLAIAVFSFLPIYFITLSRYGAFLAESQSNETQSRLSQMKEMETTIKETNKKIDLLKNGALAPRVKDIFLEILASRTEGITITRLSYDFGGVVSKKGKEDVSPANIFLQGRSSSRAALLLFKDTLAQKKEFSTIDLPISSLVKDTDLAFLINISMASVIIPDKTK